MPSPRTKQIVAEAREGRKRRNSFSKISLSMLKQEEGKNEKKGRPRKSAATSGKKKDPKAQEVQQQEEANQVQNKKKLVHKFVFFFIRKVFEFSRF